MSDQAVETPAPASTVVTLEQVVAHVKGEISKDVAKISSNVALAVVDFVAGAMAMYIFLKL